MVKHVAAYNEGLLLSGASCGRNPLKVSVEVEKTKPELAELIPLADVVSLIVYLLIFLQCTLNFCDIIIMYTLLLVKVMVITALFQPIVFFLPVAVCQ